MDVIRLLWNLLLRVVHRPIHDKKSSELNPKWFCSHNFLFLKSVSHYHHLTMHNVSSLSQFFKMKNFQDFKKRFSSLNFPLNWDTVTNWLLFVIIVRKIKYITKYDFLLIRFSCFRDLVFVTSSKKQSPSWILFGNSSIQIYHIFCILFVSCLYLISQIHTVKILHSLYSCKVIFLRCNHAFKNITLLSNITLLNQ